MVLKWYLLYYVECGIQNCWSLSHWGPTVRIISLPQRLLYWPFLLNLSLVSSLPLLRFNIKSPRRIVPLYIWPFKRSTLIESQMRRGALITVTERQWYYFADKHQTARDPPCDFFSTDIWTRWYPGPILSAAVSVFSNLWVVSCCADRSGTRGTRHTRLWLFPIISFYYIASDKFVLL